MRRVRSMRTSAEVALVSALKKASLSFETNCADIPGKPDIVFRLKRLAIFVDGEFWHGGQWYKRGLTSLGEQFGDPIKRQQWTKKIKGNVSRDFSRTSTLLTQGWTIIRFWDSDIKNDVAKCVQLIRKALGGKTAASPATLIPNRDVSEFFAGIGLARLGLLDAGWKVRFANDNAADKISFYKENFSSKEDRIDERDIHKVKANDIPNVSLATACFPCTDLSLAGAQRGLEVGTESSAYLVFTSLLKKLKKRRPPIVLLENVVGMLHSRDGLDFRICLERLAEAGYTVDPFVLDAKWFVPQSRPRLFVVAVRDDFEVANSIIPDCLDYASNLRPQQLRSFISANPSIPWSLRRLPQPEARQATLASVLEQIPTDDSRWWSSTRATKLYKQMSKTHKTTVRLQMKSKRPIYSTIFRRMRNECSMAELRTDGLAGCLRTPKGGSARQILFRACNGKYTARLLTPRECARLMGADTIRIPKTASANTALFAFGDGVCVPAIRWIAEHYLNPLATELIHGCVLRSSPTS